MQDSGCARLQAPTPFTPEALDRVVELAQSMPADASAASEPAAAESLGQGLDSLGLGVTLWDKHRLEGDDDGSTSEEPAPEGTPEGEQYSSMDFAQCPCLARNTTAPALESWGQF